MNKKYDFDVIHIEINYILQFLKVLITIYLDKRHRLLKQPSLVAKPICKMLSHMMKTREELTLHDKLTFSAYPFFLCSFCVPVFVFQSIAVCLCAHFLNCIKRMTHFLTLFKLTLIASEWCAREAGTDGTMWTCN